MCKKPIILSFIFLLIGAAAFGWAFAKQSKEKRLLQEQQEMRGQTWKLEAILHY